MAGEEKNLPPRIYHTNDPDGIFALWRELVDKLALDENAEALLFQEIFDPDTAPMVFVELMLRNLGNPFTNIYLTDTQKRKLVKLLVPIYRQKGTLRGVFNAIRLLTGIVTDIIDPHGVDEDTWQIGKSEIGEATFTGGERIYCNLLSYTEDFGNPVWTKLNTAITQDATLGPQPWYRQADKVNFPLGNSYVQQQVTPLIMANEDFTGSIFAKASAPTTLQAIIQSAADASDITITDLSLTTDWQRFEFHHKIKANSLDTNLLYKFKHATGFAGDIYLWGAHLIRAKELQPYAPSLGADGSDCSDTGRWAYHFIVVCLDNLTPSLEMIIRSIIDYMKPAHTHYTLVFPNNQGPQPDFFDHWEVGISEVGENTYVH